MRVSELAGRILGVAHLSVTFRPHSGHTAASGGAINSPKFSYCGPYGDGLTHTPQERPPERGSNAFSARPHAGDQGQGGWLWGLGDVGAAWCWSRIIRDHPRWHRR